MTGWGRWSTPGTLSTGYLCARRHADDIACTKCTDEEPCEFHDGWRRGVDLYLYELGEVWRND